MCYFELTRVFLLTIFYSEMKVIYECSLLNFLEKMLANHIFHMQWILEGVMKTQKSQGSEQATADLPDSLMHAGHSEPRNVDVWPQDFKNK
jgi:hypothetical protein